MAQATPDSRRIDRLGDYTVHRVLGEGGMGIVYDATERLSGRRVALKVIHSSLARSEDARTRFFSEMRIMGSLEHPCIVRSLANSEIDGKLVMVLEYVEGHTLRDEITRNGALPVDRVIAIAKGVAAALIAAHEREPAIVHRDLKPENLMLLPDGSVKVMDFGIAKVLSGEAGVTRASESVGTVQYMSPEQAEGRQVTPQTDLYALGLVIYEMLTGRPTFESTSLMALLRDHCETTPPSFPVELRATIPGELDRLVFDLLQKYPDYRPKGARAVLAVLESLTSPPNPGTSPPNPLSRSGRGGISLERPATAVPARKVDTIALLDRSGRSGRWWIVGAILVVAGIAAALVVPRFLTASAPAKKKTSAKTAAPEVTEAPATPTLGAPPPTTSASAIADCKATACVPFAPTNLTNLDIDFLLAEATKLARSLDASAELSQLSFHHNFPTRVVDLTAPEGFTTVIFESVENRIQVNVEPTRLRAHRSDMSREPRKTGPIKCTFPQALDAIVKAGIPLTVKTRAALSAAAIPTESDWHFHTLAAGGRVNASTCKVRFVRKSP